MQTGCLCLTLSACAQWVGGECNLPWSAPRISSPSACCPRFFQRKRRRCRATRAGLDSLRLPLRSATRCMMRVPQPQRHSRARTPRILRAMGGLLHKVCTLLQWNLEARGVHNPDPLRPQVCSEALQLQACQDLREGSILGGAKK